MEWALYRDSSDGTLCQGDILRADALRDRLRGHQDYFADNARFASYAVITQSCDLAREVGRSEFILLAVVRTLREALGMRHVEGGAKDQTDRLLSDLLNHNYNKRGFFFLPADLNRGIAEDSVVDLRVMFSMHKAHHDHMVRARCAGLTDVYAAQLGHMVGYMYGRVATPGWDDVDALKKRVRELRTQLVEREDMRMKELTAIGGSGCAVSGCGKTAETYRWLSVKGDELGDEERECLLCLDHARGFDNGHLSADAAIRIGI